MRSIKGNFKSKDPAEIDFALLREARSIVNPKLTEKGEAQARELGEALKASGQTFDVCVTTPLARAMQTAHLAIGGLCSKFIVTPDATETAVGPSGLKLAGPQRGHCKADMVANHPFLLDGGSQLLWDISPLVEEGNPQGAEANWVRGEPIVPTEEGGGAIGPAYYNPKPIEERLAPLAAMLKGLDAERVVVVGHSGVFDKLVGKDMKNCELLEDDLAKWT